jgi:glycosyltransferase involved in cell wall biosynthesis
MRIAHLIASADVSWGGPSGVLRGMTAALAARGHAVTVFATDAAPEGARSTSAPEAGFDPRVTVRRARVDLSRPPYPSLAYAALLARALGGFDVAHLHGLFSAPTTTALLTARALRVPVVLRPCGMLDPWSLAQGGALKAAWWRHLDGPLALGAAVVQASTPHEAEGIAEAFARLLSRAPRPPVVVAPQGVPPSPPFSAAGPSPHPRPYLLALGRVAEKKGLPLLVAAFARLAVVRPDLDLLIVGPDERGHAAEVRDAAARHGLEGRVFLPGAVFDPTGKSALYAHALAFCLPSADENFGVALVEAASFGVPLVVTPTVGLAPHILTHQAGRVAAPEAEAFGSAIAEVLARRGELTAGARSLAAHFTWERRVVAIEALYRRAIAVA